MNITSFTNQAVLLLQEQFGDSYHVFSRRVTKNNGVTLTGIVARRENVNSFPTIYVDDYYREDMSEKELRITVSEMADRLRQADLKRPVDLSDFTDFSRAKRKLSFKLINTEKNRKMLGDVPNRPFFNLSIVYFYLIENAPFSGKATVLIRKSHMDTWNVTEEELYEAAYLNAPRLLPPKIENMNEVLQNFIHIFDFRREEPWCIQICCLIKLFLRDIPGIHMTFSDKNRCFSAERRIFNQIKINN